MPRSKRAPIVFVVASVAFCVGVVSQTFVRDTASHISGATAEAEVTRGSNGTPPPTEPDFQQNRLSAASTNPAVPKSLGIVLARDAAASPDNPVDARIDALQDQIRSHGAESVSLEQLGWAYVEKARASGDDGYYQMAAHSARAIRELPQAEQDGNPEADLLEGHALHALHRFQEAERVAARLVARRGSPLDYALHGDTLLDQGRIEDAVAAYEQMMQGRPDSRAYSRVAEVRLLTGDLEGAREAMHTAAHAVSPRDRSSFAWIWARLALLDLQSGKSDHALTAAQTAVEADPGSPMAELVFGRVLLAAGDSAGAIAPLERSAAASPLAETLRALADAYTGTGRDVEAARTLAKLDSDGGLHDPRGVSVWLAESGKDPARALRMAEAELERRRDVYTFDALAVASAATGRVDEARHHMNEAMAAGTQDPRLWYHAGIVAAAANAPGEARDWFLKARSGEQMLLPSQRRDLAQRLENVQAALATKSVARSPA